MLRTNTTEVADAKTPLLTTSDQKPTKKNLTLKKLHPLLLIEICQFLPPNELIAFLRTNKFHLSLRESEKIQRAIYEPCSDNQRMRQLIYLNGLFREQTTQFKHKPSVYDFNIEQGNSGCSARAALIADAKEKVSSEAFYIGQEKNICFQNCAWLTGTAAFVSLLGIFLCTPYMAIPTGVCTVCTLGCCKCGCDFGSPGQHRETALAWAFISQIEKLNQYWDREKKEETSESSVVVRASMS